MLQQSEIPQDFVNESDAIKRRLKARAIGQAVDADRRIEPDPISSVGVVDRLRLKFGMGDRPETRLKFFMALSACVEARGQIVLNAISKAVASSVGSRQPDRYFCSTVKVILLEAGIAIMPEKAGASW